MHCVKNKKKVGGIFCDLEKAFDCVNHDILLSKLDFYRGKGKIIKSHLKNRYQKILTDSKVSYQSIFSDWDKVKHGVPLGSILGIFSSLFVLTTYQKSLKLTLNQSSLQMIQA